MNRQIPRPRVPWMALCGVLLACGDPLGPDDPNVVFDAAPDTVVAGDTVQVVFALRNRAPYPLTVRSSWGCPFFLETLRDGERVPWKGSDYFCTAAITDFEIAPGDSLHVVHELVAAPASGSGDAELSPGTYRIRARMNIAMDDLETEVTVRGD